jgi:hypothetical protein
MNWIDKCIAAIRARDARESKIRNHACRMFDLLWEQVQADFRHANESGFFGDQQVFVDGNGSERDVKLIRPTRPATREIRLQLSRDLHTIVVDGYPRFLIGVGEDGTVRLQNVSGSELELSQASEDILRPFLFPELEPANCAQMSTGTKVAQHKDLIDLRFCSTLQERIG